MTDKQYCNIDGLDYKKVWMIHETNDNLLNKLKKLDKETNILVWDDGLLSQFYPIKVLQELGFCNILAISTNIVNYATLEYSNDKNCIFYEFSGFSHKRFHESMNACAFMRWNQINELYSLGVNIAAHGYNHERLEKNLLPNAIILKDICKRVRNDFKDNLGYYPDLYVYPYNLKFEWSDSLINSFHMDTIGPGRLNAKDL